MRAPKKRQPLQWGRVVIDAERAHTADTRERCAKLQWGRVVIDAESLPHHLRRQLDPLASMGPRRDRRGELASRLTTRRARSCFNGAAS